MNAASRRPAVPRHRAEPPGRDRVDARDELRQAGPPPARVPDRARPLLRGRAGRVRRRGLPRPRRASRQGRGAVPDRRRRARAADAEGRRRAGRRHADVVHRTGDARRAHRSRRSGRGRGRRPAGAIGSSPRCRCASPTTSTRARAGRPRCSPSTASCRATGRCSTARAPPDRPTSPSSAPPTRSTERIGALAEIGVTDFAAVEFGRRPRRGRGDPGGARRWRSPLGLGGGGISVAAALDVEATGMRRLRRDLLEEVVALVVDDDEGREVDDLDLPHRLHAELGVLEHLDLADVVEGEAGGRAADRAEVEPAVGWRTAR